MAASTACSARRPSARDARRSADVAGEHLVGERECGPLVVGEEQAVRFVHRPPGERLRVLGRGQSAGVRGELRARLRRAARPELAAGGFERGADLGICGLVGRKREVARPITRVVGERSAA